MPISEKGLLFSFFVCLTGSILLNNVIAKDRYKSVSSGHYIKTPIGIPVTADLGSDKTLDVVIDENFNDNQKQAINNAINELDIDLKGVNYNILLDSDQADYKCIKIFKDDYHDKHRTILGLTNLNYNLFYGKVVFPVDITLYTENYSTNFKDPDFSSEYFSALVKHEMLHVLGFQDIYDMDYMDKTIMFGALTPYVQLTDLSQADKDMVNSVYPEIIEESSQNLDNVQLPKVRTTKQKPFYVYPKQKNKEEEYNL